MKKGQKVIAKFFIFDEDNVSFEATYLEEGKVLKNGRVHEVEVIEPC